MKITLNDDTLKIAYVSDHISNVLYNCCYHGNNKVIKLWNKIPADTLCVQFSFCFLRLQFYFVNYVIVSCELPYYNSFDQRMMLKN